VIAESRHLGKNRFTFDVLGDVLETAHLPGDSPASGAVNLGEGTANSFVQRSEVTGTFRPQSADRPHTPSNQGRPTCYHI
jgi:hypothetical protein